MSVPRSVRIPPDVDPQRITPPGAGPLAALTAGPDEAPVALLLPGYTGSKEDFLAVLPVLGAAGRHVIAIDLPGQYESDGGRDPDGYRLAGLAETVLAVCREIAPSLPVHLLGHSFGGLVARRAVLREPGRFRSLVLLGSGPGALSGQRAEHLRLLRPVFAEGGLPAVWAASRELEAAVQPPVSRAVEEFLERRFLATDPVALDTMADELLTAPDEVADLASTGIPVLVLHGEQDDAWSPAEQLAMASRLRARYAVIPGAGHSPAVDSPAATARLLAEFWSATDLLAEGHPQAGTGEGPPDS